MDDERDSGIPCDGQCQGHRPSVSRIADERQPTAGSGVVDPWTACAAIGHRLGIRTSGADRPTWATDDLRTLAHGSPATL